MLTHLAGALIVMSVDTAHYPSDELPPIKGDTVVTRHDAVVKTSSSTVNRAAVLIALQVVIIILLAVVLGILSYHVAQVRNQSTYAHSRQLYADEYSGAADADEHGDGGWLNVDGDELISADVDARGYDDDTMRVGGSMMRLNGADGDGDDAGGGEEAEDAVGDSAGEEGDADGGAAEDGGAGDADAGDADAGDADAGDADAAADESGDGDAPAPKSGKKSGKKGGSGGKAGKKAAKKEKAAAKSEKKAASKSAKKEKSAAKSGKSKSAASSAVESDDVDAAGSEAEAPEHDEAAASDHDDAPQLGARRGRSNAVSGGHHGAPPPVPPRTGAQRGRANAMFGSRSRSGSRSSTSGRGGSGGAGGRGRSASTSSDSDSDSPSEVKTPPHCDPRSIKVTPAHPATVPRTAAAWDHITLDQVLATPQLHTKLTLWANSVHVNENFEFLVAAEAFKKLFGHTAVPTIQTRAQHLLDQFVGDEAHTPVNLDSDAVQRLRDALTQLKANPRSQPWKLEIFCAVQAAEDVIRRLIAPRFINDFKTAQKRSVGGAAATGTGTGAGRGQGRGRGGRTGTGAAATTGRSGRISGGGRSRAGSRGGM